MNDVIETPRLCLVRLQDTSEGSQHVQWFHEQWTDDAVTAWSLHGKCHTYEESRDWFIEQRKNMDNILYGIFVKNDASGKAYEDPGVLVGNIGLRTQDGPTLPPFPPSTPSLSASSDLANKSLNLRSIGYAFYESAWGKGYATEAGRAVLDAYISFIAEEKAKGEQLFYIEGSWDKDNPASQRVLQKLGFKEVGWKTVDKPVFLAGKWRDPGYWIYGMYLE